MKHSLVKGGVLAVAVLALSACDKPKVDTVEQKAAYSIGYMTGKEITAQLPQLDQKNYLIGFKEGASKKTAALTEEQMKEAMIAFQKKMMEDMKAKQEKEAGDALSKGKAYLDQNAKKPGVKVTASGLQYEVLTEGKGPKPKATDKVKVDYEGRLIDGKVFDSSIARKEPVSFVLNQVVPGWTEGVQLMSVGSKYKFTIPANLGYGEAGAGPIPANSVLVFEVELLAIEK